MVQGRVYLSRASPRPKKKSSRPSRGVESTTTGARTSVLTGVRGCRGAGAAPMCRGGGKSRKSKSLRNRPPPYILPKLDLSRSEFPLPLPNPSASPASAAVSSTLDARPPLVAPGFLTYIQCRYIFCLPFCHILALPTQCNLLVSDSLVALQASSCLRFPIISIVG